MFVLKLRRIGTSLGLILPAKMLRHLNVREGEEVVAIETSGGYSIAVLDEAAREQVETGDALMDRYDEVFVGLAKQPSGSNSR